MIRRYKRLAAWLGLFAMLMALAGPLYSQLRALDSVALAQIDLSALHCGVGAEGVHQGPPAWVHHLEQCGYCDLLAQNPALASRPAWPVPLPAPVSRLIPSPEQGQFREPSYRLRARGPPSIHA
ncbi:DUF2946 domain-containing protein [Stutzerimonas tarimensis]|uniref:DUF2946 domain-containing protein n=1 Tax=Stutzerimonas tarimensis TaxID=1507735 RepID=A0ABV7T4P2_9GAMM